MGDETFHEPHVLLSSGSLKTRMLQALPTGYVTRPVCSSLFKPDRHSILYPDKIITMKAEFFLSLLYDYHSRLNGAKKAIHWPRTPPYVSSQNAVYDNIP